MKRFAILALAVLSFSFAFRAAAAEYSDLYIVPAAGHAHGAFGTLWRSDVVLHNIQAVPITVEMALVESGRSPSTAPIPIVAGAETSLLLAPGETRVIADVAGGLGRDVAGALIVGADLPFAVSSRTYAESAAGATLGQNVLPMPLSGNTDAIAGTSVLAGLSVSERHRSNIGVFIAASEAPLVAEITLLAPSGASLGSRVVVVEEPGFIHQQLSTADIAPAADAAAAVVRVLDGEGIVVPYASLIDNASAEAISVSGQPVAAHGASARTMLSSVVAAAACDR